MSLGDTTIAAIDPGPTKSAIVVLRDGKPVSHGIHDNELLVLELVKMDIPRVLVIEQVQHYGSGMAVGAEVFDTVFWSGRFAQAFGREFHRISRPKIKAVLCGSAKAKDPNVRQALIDRFGGKEAIGNKKKPGPLYGIRSHEWAALAVAVAYMENGSNA